ncbi:MAG: efflux RND transporter periplasmic adaptor subunit [Bacteroides sp.]|nr:efflux RND transporter periplasmic adaptor subunit [Bacteroidales bacterium]MBD5378593.1 efflux RND transporter periplasmic adaptor subunit [Bacteroides sp.]
MILASCGGNNANQQMMQQAAPQIATVTLNYSNSDLSTTYPATIKGKTDVEIRPQVSGFITRVLVDEGQYVVKGQPLFNIDNVQFQAAVDNARAAVNVAQTAVQTATLTAQNKQQLFDKNIISEYENQLAQNDLAMAKSQLAQAQANLITAQKNLSYTIVTAPSSGVIGSIPNREGTLASPSMVQPLTTVSDNGDVYAYISLTEKDILQLTDNGKYSLNEKIKEMPEVTLRLSDGAIYPEPGKVSTVSGIIDNTTGSASVRILFKNPNGMLRSGSTGQILMPVRMDSVIVIPQKATTELQNLRYAYVVNDSNVVTSVPITVSPINDGKNFVVTSGLKAGQRIAIEGVGTKVRNGSVIQPIDPAQAAAQAQQQAAAQAAGK